MSVLTWESVLQLTFILKVKIQFICSVLQILSGVINAFNVRQIELHTLTSERINPLSENSVVYSNDADISINLNTLN